MVSIAWHWSRRTFTAVSLLLVLAATGCSSWKATHRTVPVVLAEKPRDQIRVGLADGAEMVVKHPEVRGDSLYGLTKQTVMHENGFDSAVIERPGAVALADVRIVDVRKIDAHKTVTAATIGVGIAAVVLFFAIAAATSDRDLFGNSH